MKHIGRIKIVRESDDVMECETICPHCGATARYGSMYIVCGIHCCPQCHDQLLKTVTFDRTHNYEAYVRKADGLEYEPYAYREEGK